MSILVRYPGRVALLGEHCDWAGGSSLAVPLPLGIELTVEHATDDLSVRSELDGELLEGRWPITGLTDAEGGPLRFVPAAAALLRERGISAPSAWVWTRADLPTGRGFSSSAAFSLAILDGLARHAGVALPAEELAELAYVLEHDRLGVACGRLDPLACVAGAPVLLRWQDGRAPLRRLTPLGRFHLVVGAFSAPRDTRGILAALNQAWHAPLTAPRTQVVHAAFHRWGILAERGARAIEAGDPMALGAAMNEAQRIYEIDLVPRLPALRAPLLHRTCATLLERGAVGAKFSGAGGDGSVIALLLERAEARAAVDWLQAQQIPAWHIVIEEA